MLSQRQSIIGLGAIIFACFFWGTTGTVASFTLNVSPLATGAFAMGGGGLLLVLTALKNLFSDKYKLVANYPIMLLGGLSVAVYPLAFYSSMRLSGVALGTVVSIASAPFATVLLEWLISKKPISKKWLKSFAIGAVGVLLLAMSKGEVSESGTHIYNHYLGIMLGLLAGFTYALYSWAAREMIEQGIHSKSAMASMFGLASLLLLPSLIITGDNLFASTKNAAVALYMAFVPMFLGYLLFGYGLRFIAASEATLLTLLEPAVATLMAVVVVGEKIFTIGWLGILLIMVCMLIQMPKRIVSSA
ncbi:DMT family transporter [Zooshikella ganghwensis]|uniref:EamA family transporter n=1 Tax=Zooshikella ganghwensis TaxID=202772 RepID=A0A4P9VG01_9GAMM|nr:EamA family transporter [Zooshikella ganghwensis]RDH41973.1 EamA family transporter [Zooshikella ganghwensis]